MKKEHFLGIVLAFSLGFLAFLSTYLVPFNMALVALFLGIGLGNLMGENTSVSAGAKWVEKEILSFVIVLLGAGFNLRLFQNLTYLSLIWVMAMVFLVYFFAQFLGKGLGLSAKLAALLGAGSAICGSSAIIATTGLIKPKTPEIGLSLGIVNLLGSLGIIALPFLAAQLALNPERTGLLLGGTLQSMGHVVAAGFSLDKSVAEWASVVKMLRISMMIPFIIYLAFVFQSKASDKKVNSFNLPYFIPGFLILAGLNSFFSDYDYFFKGLAKLGDWLILPSMAAIGLGIQIKPLLHLAPKTILAGLLIFAFQISSYLLFILFVF